MSTDPRVTQAQRQFAMDVGRTTGFDPRVIYAWAQQEGAYAPGGTGGYNFLNLRPQQGDPYSSVSSGGYEKFRTLHDAETATIWRIRTLLLHERPSQNYTLAEHVTPGSQIGLIAASPWEQSHYGGTGGPNLRRAFAGLYGAGALDQPAKQIVTGAEATPGHPAGSVTTQGPLTAADWTSYSLTDLPHALPGLLGWLFGHLVRAVEIVAGAVLVLVGILIFARAASGSSTGAATRGGVRGAAGAVR